MSLRAIDATVFGEDRPLLDEVTAEVVPGRVLAVVGPNGAGKSTLMRVLAGDLAPDAGVVRLEEKKTNRIAPGDLARVRAVIPQASSVGFAFLVRDLVLLSRIPHNHGSETSADVSIAMLALETVEAAHLAGRVFNTLSGGEQQRVRLARALSQIWQDEGSPRYLLADEPTSALDLRHQYACLELVRELAARAVGVCIVLHDLNLAARYADDVLVLKDGRPVAFGAADNVLTPEILRVAFDVEVVLVGGEGCSRPWIATVAKH